jgi:hypothetical protein
MHDRKQTVTLAEIRTARTIYIAVVTACAILPMIVHVIARLAS